MIDCDCCVCRQLINVDYYYYYKNLIPQVVKIPGLKTKKAKIKMSDGHRSGRSTGRVSCKSTELLLLLLLFILLSAERHTQPRTLPGPLWWYDTIRCGVFTCLKNWLLDRLVWRTELKTEKLRRWSASVTTKSDDVRWPLYGEDEKAQDRRCADVTDRDAEWRSMAPRDHRVIGCRRYGFLAAREGASVPTTQYAGRCAAGAVIISL